MKHICCYEGENKYPSSKQRLSCVEQFLLKLQSLVVEICQTGNSIWRLRAFMLLGLPMISLIFLIFWEKKDENHFMSYWITITLCGESNAGGFVSLLMTGNIVFTLSLLLLIISCLFLFKIKNTKSLFINVIVNLFFCWVCTLLQFYPVTSLHDGFCILLELLCLHGTNNISNIKIKALNMA